MKKRTKLSCLFLLLIVLGVIIAKYDRIGSGSVCHPFSVDLPQNTDASSITFWNETGMAIQTIPVSATRHFESPNGACAITTEYLGRMD